MKHFGLLTGLGLLAGIWLLAGCSTTRVLAEDEARLAENKVVVTNDPKYNASSLMPYVKQKANSEILGQVTPFLYVYNWQNGKNGGWDRFCQKLGQAPVVFDESLIDDSVNSILNHLEYEGYYNSEVSPEATVKKKLAKVRYNVTLGKRFPIRTIDYQVRDTALASLLAADSANFTVNCGDWLSQESLEAESERLSRLFRNRGYWGFSKNYFFFYADTTTIRDTADLIVRIEDYTRNESEENARPHRKYKIGNVALMPQPGMRVRQKFLHNLNQLQPGEPYSEDRINQTYDRFASIPLFSSVNMLLRESQFDSTAVDCSIMLSQARLQAVKVNLEGSFNSVGLFGVTPSLSYSHKNLFGGGEVFSLGFRGNFQFMLHEPVRSNEFSVSTGLSIPWYPSFVWKMPYINLPQMDINFSYNYQNRPEYNRNILTGTYGFSWNVSKRFYYQIYPFQLSAVKASRIDSDFYASINDPYLKNAFRSHLDLGGGGMFYFTTNSTVNPKVSYFYTRFQFDFSGNMASFIGRALHPRSGEGRDRRSSECRSRSMSAVRSRPWKPSGWARPTSMRSRCAPWPAPVSLMATPWRCRSRSCSTPVVQTACAVGGPVRWARAWRPVTRVSPLLTRRATCIWKRTWSSGSRCSGNCRVRSSSMPVTYGTSARMPWTGNPGIRAVFFLSRT